LLGTRGRDVIYDNPDLAPPFATLTLIQLAADPDKRTIKHAGRCRKPLFKMGSSRPTARILVVEDDELVARTFERMLGAAGFRVSVAFTAEAAFEQIAQNVPDALLLDFRLPRRSGLELLYRLRRHERFAQLPVLVMTGTRLSDETLDEVSALRATVRYKPFSLVELVSDLRALFNATREAFER